jgi:hypothetical protein
MATTFCSYLHWNNCKICILQLHVEAKPPALKNPVSNTVLFKKINNPGSILNTRYSIMSSLTVPNASILFDPVERINKGAVRFCELHLLFPCMHYSHKKLQITDKDKKNITLAQVKELFDLVYKVVSHFSWLPGNLVEYCGLAYVIVTVST